MHKLGYLTPIKPERGPAAPKLVTFVFILWIAAMWAPIVWLVASHYPDNHISVDFRWTLLAAFPPIGWVIVAVAAFREMDRWTISLAIAIGMLFVLTLVVDRFNLMVEYNIWTSRGMPDPWTFTGW